MLVSILIFLIIFIVIFWGVLRHYYLKEKYELTIREKMNSLGFQLSSIKKIDRPSFMKDNFPTNLFHNPIILTSYRFIEFTNKDDEKFTGFVSIYRIVNETQSLRYYLDLNNKGAYDIIK